MAAVGAACAAFKILSSFSGSTGLSTYFLTEKRSFIISNNSINILFLSSFLALLDIHAIIIFLFRLLASMHFLGIYYLKSK